MTNDPLLPEAAKRLAIEHQDRYITRRKIEQACAELIADRWRPRFGRYDTLLPKWWWVLPKITTTRTQLQSTMARP